MPVVTHPIRRTHSAAARQNGKDVRSAAEEENLDFRGQVAAIGKSLTVIEFRMDGTILTANDNFLKTFGYALDEVKGKHHGIFVEEGYRLSAEYKDFWARLNRGEYHAAEYKRIGNGGKEVWVQGSYNPILDSNSKPFKVVQYAMDATQQVKARQELVAMAERQKIGAEELHAKVGAILDVVQVAAKGDLTREITVHGADAIGQMGEGLSKFFKDLRSSISAIAQNSESLANSC